MKFIALKTEDGKKKGRIAFCCKMLGVSRQGFYRYLVNRNRPWKYQRLAEIMREICSEDQCNDTYGRMRMYQALRMKKPDGVEIPGEKTVYRIMKKIGLTHHPKRKPNGITKADREAMKSDDLLKRDFRSDEPLKKCITDITEIKAKDGKLYTSVIFDCFDLSVFPCGGSCRTAGTVAGGNLFVLLPALDAERNRRTKRLDTQHNRAAYPACLEAAERRNGGAVP